MKASATLMSHIGVWRSLVARIVRDDEVGGSNPLTPTCHFLWWDNLEKIKGYA